jgi:two-component system chemotaxis sensor kinase CheA
MSADPYKYFRIEAREIVEQLGQGVMELEKGTSGPELIAKLLRLAHTLKGAARVVKQTDIADKAHSVEDVLEPYREGSPHISKQAAETLLELVDGISSQVAALTATRQPGEAAQTDSRAVDPVQPVQMMHVDQAELDQVLDGISEAHSQIGLFRKPFAYHDRASRLVDLLRTQRAAWESRPPRAGRRP